MTSHGHDVLIVGTRDPAPRRGPPIWQRLRKACWFYGLMPRMNMDNHGCHLPTVDTHWAWLQSKSCGIHVTITIPLQWQVPTSRGPRLLGHLLNADILQFGLVKPYDHFTIHDVLNSPRFSTPTRTSRRLGKWWTETPILCFQRRQLNISRVQYKSSATTARA